MFKSRLPYRLAFDMELVELVEPTRLVGHASGELIGSGTWELTPVDGGTQARYTCIYPDANHLGRLMIRAPMVYA